jgi:serine/threonine-protein kinase HipA
MDGAGDWQLAPAYDRTHSPRPGDQNQHQLTVNGKHLPGKPDILAFSREAGIENAEDILEEVSEVVSQWAGLAKAGNVRGANVQRIAHAIESNLVAIHG